MIRALFIGGPWDRKIETMPGLLKTVTAHDVKNGTVTESLYEIEFANLAGDQVIYFVKDYDHRQQIDRLHALLTVGA